MLPNRKKEPKHREDQCPADSLATLKVESSSSGSQDRLIPKGTSTVRAEAFIQALDVGPGWRGAGARPISAGRPERKKVTGFQAPALASSALQVWTFRTASMMWSM